MTELERNEFLAALSKLDTRNYKVTIMVDICRRALILIIRHILKGEN